MTPHAPLPPSGRHGFTLIEMALVVAIIGMLAGAVVAGQSFVHAARLSTMVNEAKYFHEALARFEARYEGIAGDLPGASGIWAGAGDGDGNGFIMAGTDNGAEIFLTFQHLANAGMIEGRFTGATGGGGTTAAVLGSNIPMAPLNNSGYYFQDISTDYVTGSAGYFDGYYHHPLFVGGRVAGNLPTNSLISGREAYQLDDKYDDGKPGTGTIRSLTGASSPNCVNGTAVTGATYLGTNEAIGCRLIFTGA